jgi:uncharacterized phage-associated protein
MVCEADSGGRDLTNLALQKLLYFAHAIFLIENGQPLVTGYFEAWQYGPVHPAVYRAFKEARGEPIKFKATRRNIVTGETTEIEPPSDLDVCSHVRRIMGVYGRMTPGRLVEIAHAKNAPWHVVMEKSRKMMVLGLRIPDTIIREHFRHHKVSVGRFPTVGEPREDTPPA